MKLKHKNYISTTLNRFDLLGANETGLAKSFAFLLSREPDVLYKFLRSLGVNIKNTVSNYRNTIIEIEKSRIEGRTDIEIYQKGKFHMIVECKVGKNRIDKQRTQYLQSFEDEPQKILCFITQERDCTREINPNIDIYYRGWLDIIDLIGSKFIENDETNLITEFVGYATRGFKMRNQKEVLIQDLSNPVEITRYREFNIYRRDATFGSPLYFAPYFTRKSMQAEGEGISYLSKILGVLTIRPSELKSFENELLMYANGNKIVVSNWLKGTAEDKDSDPVTYYFLDTPVKLNKPLLKDGGNKIGRGKNWIAAMIPKNRCVTFHEFTKRMVQANEKD